MAKRNAKVDMYCKILSTKAGFYLVAWCNGSGIGASFLSIYEEAADDIFNNVMKVMETTQCTDG